MIVDGAVEAQEASEGIGVVERIDYRFALTLPQLSHFPKNFFGTATCLSRMKSANPFPNESKIFDELTPLPKGP